MKDVLTKGELRFWLGLFTLAVTVVVWGAKIDSQVQAQERRDDTIEGKLDVVVDRQVKIMIHMGLQP
jgi:hypothetical protein